VLSLTDNTPYILAWGNDEGFDRVFVEQLKNLAKPEDLLIAIDALRLKSLELHWGEYDPNTWRENNCIVVTAKGQPFNRGIMLECWRHLGHLYFGPVASDWETYVENSSYAHRVLAKSAASNARQPYGGTSPSDRRTSGANHGVPFHKSVVASGKSRD